METGLLLLIAALLAYHVHQTEVQMAGEKELAERVKTLGDVAVAALTTITEVATAGAADIAKIHDLLDASTGGGVDVAGANAALDRIEASMNDALAKVAALKEQIDRPEPGDEVPPPVEG